LSQLEKIGLLSAKAQSKANPRSSETRKNGALASANAHIGVSHKDTLTVVSPKNPKFYYLLRN